MRSLIPLLLVACSTVPFPAFEPDSSSIAQAGMFVPAVSSATWQQRWVLRRGGMEIPFTLHVEVSAPDQLRFVALDDFGGTLAEATQDRVVRSSRAIPEPLAAAILDTVRCLYLPPPLEQIQFVRIQDGGIAAAYDPARKMLWSEAECWTRTGTIRVIRREGVSGWPAYFEVTGRVMAMVEARKTP